MGGRRKIASGHGLPPRNRANLESIVVRLLEVAARCGDSVTQHELMELADELAKLIEQSA